MADIVNNKNHRLKYVYGEALAVHGVVSLVDYSETSLNIKLNDCFLAVKGSGFKVELLNLETGELSVSGRVQSLVYSKSREKTSLLKKLVK